MTRIIGKFLLKLTGMKIVSGFPDIEKCIVIEAPHTSMLDFIYGKLFFVLNKRKVNFLIKERFFFFPLGPILKSMGAIPVKQKQTGSGFVQMLVKLFNENKKMSLVITPEGTRRATNRWRTGFYHIALEAKVPIVMGFIDYKKKEMGVIDIFNPTGNEDQDIKTIRSYYKKEWAKYPDLFKEI